MTAPIDVQQLSKVFRVHERAEGMGATFRSLFARQFKEVPAVQDVSFSIGEGEVVGFLGPNGAGKTTTLKMLSGLLHPTSGQALVLGHQPWRREAALLNNITLVMGNRSQLLWDIPAADSLRVLQEIFRLPEAQYRVSLNELVELLELEPLLHKPVRNLSLGERMKVEFAAALIHQPRVLFLDEPTIGLDVTMQARIRRFVSEYNRRTGATILLTSHYMDDVVALCKRVIVIHHGRLLYDGALADLAERMAPYKLIRLTLRDQTTTLDQYGEIVEREENRTTLRVSREEAPERTARMVRDLGDEVLDLTLEDPAIEEVIDRVFSGAAVPAELPGERMTWLARVYRALFVAEFAAASQYRVQALLWLLFPIIRPLVFLAAWSAAATAQGGSIGGMTTADFAAYYVALSLVSQLTMSWDAWDFEFDIRQGRLSPKLLRPLHPLNYAVVSNIVYKVTTLPVLVPALLLIGWSFGAHFETQWWHLVLFVPSIILAAALHFIFGWALAALAFWTTRIHAIMQFYDRVSFLFGGQVAPLALLPGPLAALGYLLPFGYMLWAPTEILRGATTLEQTLGLIAIEAVWLVFSSVLYVMVWRAGVRQYSAVGA